MDIRFASIFSPFADVDGWFTLKNDGEINTDGTIPGLNCGLDTGSPAEEAENNRSRLYEHLSIDSHAVALARQVHREQVAVVDQGGIYGETDALVTEKRGLALGIQVADCAAVLLADPDCDVIGAAHAGWRGVLAKVVPKTVEKMQRVATARPDRMIAYISPAISTHFFEVGEEVAERFPDEYVDRSSYHKPHIDLKGIIYKQLRETGIPDRQIQVDKDCTYRDTHKYYSYRREGNRAGRMLALIRLN